MIAAYFVISVFIAWIWIDYYRLIEIYHREDLKYFLFTFALGCASVLIVIGSDKLIKGSPLQLSGGLVNDFFYCVLKIGMVEELAKLTPFLIVYFLFKKQFNEPIDFLAFISVSALGFSAIENTIYFNKYGPVLINSRAILSSVSHMFDSAIIAYGIILMKYRNQKFSTPTLLGFFLLAALSHGFFDFWLINEQTKSGGWVITVYYFFITISIFATILNNALNNSSFFSYKRVVNSSFVANRMLTYYAVVFLIQIVLLSFKENTFYAIRNFIGSLNTTGFITVVAVVRLSRFKLIKNRWQRIRVEMPFSMGGGAFGNQSSGSLFNIRIKGESYNEAFINTFYQEYFYLTAVSSRSTELEDDQLAYIEEKLFLKDDETFYLSKIFKNQNKDNFERRLLKPKTNGTTIMNKKYPIVGLLMIESDDELTNTNLSAGDFEFQVWAYIKPVENKPSL